MALESGGMAEPLATLGTHKGLLARVDALMLPQVAQVVKVAAAVPALVAPLQLVLLLKWSTSSSGTSASPARYSCSSSTILLLSSSTPGLSAAGGLQGATNLLLLFLLLSSSSSRVWVDQLEVLLQEHSVWAEGPTKGADVGVTADEGLP